MRRVPFGAAAGEAYRAEKRLSGRTGAGRRLVRTGNGILAKELTDER